MRVIVVAGRALNELVLGGTYRTRANGDSERMIIRIDLILSLNVLSIGNSFPSCTSGKEVA